MRPFGCLVTILNTIDHLGKFDGKADEGFFVRYSLNSKAFRVFNSRTRIVEENLHIRFSKSTPNVVGRQYNGFAGTKASDNTSQARKETEPVKYYILLPLWTADLPFSQDPENSHDDGSKPSSDDGMKVDEDPRKDSECKDQEKEDNVNSTNNVNIVGNINTVSSTINVADINKVNTIGGKRSIGLPFDLNMHALEDDSIFDFSRDDENDGSMADMNNLDTTIQVSPNPTTRIHKDHHLDQVIGDLQSATLTRKMSNNLREHRIEAIRLFLACASFKDFVVYQIDVKSAFLYGKIKEEVYVCQPPGFEDPDFPDRVYKVEIHCMDYIKLLELGLQKSRLQAHQWKLKILCSRMKMVKKWMFICIGQPKLGLWYPKDSLFDLVAYTDSDYARASLDRKSTTGGCQFLGCRLISWQCKKQTVVANSTTKAKYMAASSCCGQLHALVDGKKIIITESSVRRDLQLADEEGVDCLPNSTIFEQLALMGLKTTAWNKFSSTMASAIICLATN
ncbi:putative ribonuclease H-like domain-containing protein [Tanacetum coccineum]|uniref:Ribonuclease H-like domain-containing protein n=1 Tax=Tanacetum coccineum TaxID=301880 RepID=A0ABQ4ZZP4_9ASTR